MIVPRKRSDGGTSYGVSVWRDGEDVWIGTRRSHAEAKQLERDAQAEKPIDPETCGEFALRWPEDFGMVDGRPRWEPTTEYNNRLALRAFIRTFGDVCMAKLPEHKDFVSWARRQPPSNIKVLNAMLNDAARPPRLISENPLDGLMRRPSSGRQKIKAITEEELLLLGNCALVVHGFNARALVLWQGSVGSRPIALYHLKKEHVDLEAGVARLEHPGKGVEPRTVLVPPVALEAVAKMHPTDSPYLFTSLTGRRLSKSSLFYLWRPIRRRFEAELELDRAADLRGARADCGEMDLYELRHCAATSMRRRGASWEEIAWQLCQTDRGHQARTLYSHLTEEDHLASLRSLYV